MDWPTPETVKKELARSLPVKNKSLLEALAHVIAGDEVNPQASHAALAGILKGRCTVPVLMTALLQCEVLTFKCIIPLLKSMDETEQVKLIQSKREHFNALQGILFEIAQTLWESVLSNNRRAQVLSQTQSDWLKKGYVTLYNIIEEIPVRASVPLYAAKPETISIEITSELERVFAADPEMRRAYIDSPVEEYRLLMLIDRVNSRKDVTLKIADVVVSNIRDRDYLRVRVKENLHVQLVGMEGVKKIDALLNDLSVDGLGLKDVSSMDISVGDVMTINFSIRKVKAHHSCRVCWVSFNENRIGVSIQTNLRLQQALNMEILQRQREVISKLEMIGVPNTLRPLGIETKNIHHRIHHRATKKKEKRSRE